MRAPRPISKSAARSVLGACWLGAIGALAPRSADAHYVLEAPASYDTIDPETGLPEKLGPCGNEAPQTLTNAVTAFQEGQSITITINEVVFHPGHYRVALAMTRDHMQASFPDDPVPTPGSTNSGTMLCPNPDMTPCGSVPIEDPPVFPVLADNLFEHCMPFADPVSGNPQPQSTTIKLPAGVTCNKCTLQVLEFMSDHGPNVPGGCFYHHCADISIGVQVVDAGAPNGSGASGAKASSGACSTSPIPGRGRLFGTALAALAAAVGVFFFRARRRARLSSS
jgi:hypothetical protein